MPISQGPPPTPQHPRWTHAPLGGILVAAVLDVISAVDGGTHTWARDMFRAGTFVLMIATTVMFVAIITGLVDRARATVAGTRARTKSTIHGFVMAGLTVGSIVDLTVRGAQRNASHTPAGPLVLTIGVLAAALVGGELGGRLTYRAGIGVARRAESPGEGRRGTPSLSRRERAARR